MEDLDQSGPRVEPEEIDQTGTLRRGRDGLLVDVLGEKVGRQNPSVRWRSMSSCRASCPAGTFSAETVPMPPASADRRDELR